MILPFLLHHANRAIKDVAWGKDEFYKLKDQILKKGKHLGYDVQHIAGKKCHTCGGSGIHTGYYAMSGEKWEDSCNRCWRGWFKIPIWICLESIQYGTYQFHRPLKREQCIKNPFTAENMGWEVSSRKPIEGYIDHDITAYGRPAILILFFLYNRPMYYKIKSELLQQIRSEWYWKSSPVRKLFKIETYFFGPKIRIYALDEDGNIDNDYYDF